MRWNQAIASVYELAFRNDEIACEDLLVALDQNISTGHTGSFHDTFVSSFNSYELVLLVVF